MLDLESASDIEAIFLKPLSASVGMQGHSFPEAVSGEPGTDEAASLGQLPEQLRFTWFRGILPSFQNVQPRTWFFNPPNDV